MTDFRAISCDLSVAATFPSGARGGHVKVVSRVMTALMRASIDWPTVLPVRPPATSRHVPTEGDLALRDDRRLRHAHGILTTHAQPDTCSALRFASPLPGT
ncbi:hypothetical protein BOA8489_03778 [Boseongicola aestuarii]|uniref:Uncharacterized protein n=1 Tax=Boseongicola aestuarii TaxID=1470561 RepID=A0A238J6Z4_9RHOB|nr:hypothetical protein BOA8489_03778 [Boseongicola aestuarii]